MIYHRFTPLAVLACLLLGVTSCSVLRGTTEAEGRAATAAQNAEASARTAGAVADKARNRQIAQASSNLGPISEVVEARGQPALADAVRIQRQSIDAALNLTGVEYPAPTVSAADLLRDAEKALTTYRATVSQLQADLDVTSRSALVAKKLADAAQEALAAETAKADAAAKSAYWWQLGGSVLGGLATVAAIASRLGLPYAGLVESALSFLNPVMKNRRVTAEAALAGADVGRQSLNLVMGAIQARDPELAARVNSMAYAITGGKAAGILDVFKTAAAGYVMDHHGDQVNAVDALLSDLRGRVLHTNNGTAVDAKGMVA